MPLRVPPKCDATCLVHWNGVFAGPGPADRVVREGGRAAPVVDVRHHLVGGADDAVERHHLVVGALRPAFGARAVVADDVDEERVVELADRLERVDQPADLVVGVLGEAREGLHLAREQALLVGVSDPRPGFPSGRGVSFVSAGMTPSSFCRAKVSSRSLSQPRRTCPCTCRSTPSARGAAHASRRWRNT